MSSSEEDEKQALLRQAIDPSLISDDMFSNIDKKKPKSKEPQQPRKSNRTVNDEGTVDPRYNLQVSESVRKYVGKKMSEIIDKQTCYYEENAKSVEVKEDEDTGIRLFSDCKEYVTRIVEEPSLTITPQKPYMRRKRANQDEISNSEKCRLSAVDLEFLANETRSWSTRSKADHFLYKTKGGVNYLVEPVTEFTVKRKKNNWDESKIRLPLSMTVKKSNK